MVHGEYLRNTNGCVHKPKHEDSQQKDKQPIEGEVRSTSKVAREHGQGPQNFISNYMLSGAGRNHVP